MGPEGQAPQDDGYWPHAPLEGSQQTIQKWLPVRVFVVSLKQEIDLDVQGEHCGSQEEETRG